MSACSLGRMMARLTTLVAALAAVAVLATPFAWNPDFFTPIPPTEVHSFVMDPVRTDVLVATYYGSPAVVEFDLTDPTAR